MNVNLAELTQFQDLEAQARLVGRLTGLAASDGRRFKNTYDEAIATGDYLTAG